MATDRSRDLGITVATIVLGGTGASLLISGAQWAWPLISYARPELTLAFLLAVVGGGVLAWNALWACAALLSQLRILPAHIRVILFKVARVCGTGRAQRIISRSLASSVIGATVLGLGAGATFADPLDDPSPTDPASLSWIWEASDTPHSRSHTPLAPQAPARQADSQSRSSATAQSSSLPTPGPEPIPENETAPEPAPAAPAPERPRMLPIPPAAQDRAESHEAAQTQATRESKTRTFSSPAASARATADSLRPNAQQRTPTGQQTRSERSAHTSASGAPDASSTHRVLPGDTLWDIARAHLPSDADDAQIDQAWRSLYALNADTIGSDPNLIHPGQSLLLPQESK